jgi:hypothetical protein
MKGLEDYTTYGSAIADRVKVDTDDIHLSPNAVLSRAYGDRQYEIGTAPMPAALRSNLLFHDERFNYAQEVTYRTQHELIHPLLAETQFDPAVQALTEQAADLRDSSGGSTPLGSLGMYVGNKKITEDVTEMMNMFAWSPAYAREYADFLADGRLRRLHQSIGVVTITSGPALYSRIARATEAAIGI